ncbi:MAG: M42 family peptidase, partial [Clostridia bacterium]|nr:M42 family peptidase [Clostridia bacterium]
MTELLKKLCAINAPSGFEDAMREFIRTYAQPYADEIREDPAGNLMVLRRGKSDAKRIMLCAHMDEVGLIITQIDKSGLLKYAPIGRVPAAALAGKRVLVGDRAIPGIIGIKAIHMTSRKERG